MNKWKIKRKKILEERIEELEAELKKQRQRETDRRAWDFHWNGRGDYEESRRCFYGDFS